MRPTRDGTKAVPVYVKNIPRAERKDIVEAVRELLANQRILHISSIGNSVMEILTEKDCSQSILNLV